MQSLKDSSFQNLPPGGGLDAKYDLLFKQFLFFIYSIYFLIRRSIIEEVYKKFTATENGRSGNEEANNSLESKDLGIN